MHTVQRSKYVGYEPNQMFDLVNDIDSYSEFLHWCQGSRVEKSTETEIVATLDVGLGGLSKRFTTRNLLKKPHQIDIDLVDGPFRSLSGGWHFLKQNGPGCIVEIELEFDVSKTPLDKMFGFLFEEIVRSQVEAFIQRANEIYG